MTATRAVSEVIPAHSIEAAVGELERAGTDAVPLAGGTWLMRAPLRGDRMARVHVALLIDELREVQSSADTATLGALVTHAQLAAASMPSALAALTAAAARSAFPAVRHVATLGGNICAAGFAEADLVPALLAAEADLSFAGREGTDTTPLGAYLADRGTHDRQLLTAISVPTPAGRRSGFARLTVRGGGEYAVASISISVDVDDAGSVAAARVSVGAVEETARLCPAAAAELVGRALSPQAAQDAGRAAAAECSGRDALDAPGWYRLAVLPGLARQAVESMIGDER